MRRCDHHYHHSAVGSFGAFPVWLGLGGRKLRAPFTAPRLHTPTSTPTIHTVRMSRMVTMPTLLNQEAVWFICALCRQTNK